MEFAPSADHSKVVSGVPAVSRYDLSFYAVGSSQPLEVLNVGKPNPDASGKIHVSFFPSWPTPGSIYEARVTAVGSGGQAISTLSNKFSFSGQCNYVLSASALSFGSGGGNGSVDILTPATCTWNGTSSASWLSIMTGTVTGNGSLSIVAAANTTAVARTATVTIQGLDVDVTQAAASQCAASLSTTSITAPSAGVSGQFSVSVSSGCTWALTNPVSWIAATPASGATNGVVSYTVQPNATGTQRSATLKVSNQDVIVTQPTAGACATAITPANPTIGVAGGQITINVAAPASCAWAATNSAGDWAALSGATTGVGNGAVTVTVNPLPSGSSRTKSMTIGGLPLVVTQTTANSCTYSVPSSPIAAAAAGASASLAVTTQSGCSWTASSAASWVTVTPGSGSGAGSATYSVTPNTSATARSTSILVAGQNIAVSQPGVNCSPAVSLADVNAGATGATGSGTVTATAGCAWTATSAASWVTVTPGSGSGNGTVNYAVTPNTATASRSTTLTVAGKAVTVSQAGIACAPSLSLSAVNAAASGASGSVGVTVAGGCAWTASSPVSWVTLGAASGSGNGSATYTVAPNTQAAIRTATLLVAGKPVLVTQAAAAACSYTVSATNFSAPAGGTSLSVGVTAAANCAWTTTQSTSWAVLSGVKSGSGNGTVAITVNPNTATTARKGTVTIAGSVVTVDQAGASVCSPSVSTANVSASAQAQTGKITLTTTCAWTASSPVSWITLSPKSGSSSASVSYSLQANTATTLRSAQLTIAGKTVTVTQAAAASSGSCNYTVPASTSISRVATSASIPVTTTAGCSWTAKSNVSWITIKTPKGSASGSGKFTFAVQMNHTNKARSGTVTVGGKTHTVKQGG